jgi:hypothetical protein
MIPSKPPGLLLLLLFSSVGELAGEEGGWTVGSLNMRWRSWVIRPHEGGREVGGGGRHLECLGRSFWGYECMILMHDLLE